MTAYHALAAPGIGRQRCELHVTDDEDREYRRDGKAVERRRGAAGEPGMAEVGRLRAALRSLRLERSESAPVCRRASVGHPGC